MIVELLTACVMIAWAPASGEPNGHYFYEDALPAIVALTPEMEVCQPEGEWNVPHIYSVAGFLVDEEGTHLGPESDDLTVVWVPEPDAVYMLLAGWVLFTALFWWRNRG